MQETIQKSIGHKISGKALTPFLWGTLKDIASDKILHTNISLIRNNARLAAHMAVADAAKKKN